MSKYTNILHIKLSLHSNLSLDSLLNYVIWHLTGCQVLCRANAWHLTNETTKFRYLTYISILHLSHLLDNSHNLRKREHMKKAAIHKIWLFRSIVFIQLVVKSSPQGINGWADLEGGLFSTRKCPQPRKFVGFLFTCQTTIVQENWYFLSLINTLFALRPGAANRIAVEILFFLVSRYENLANCACILNFKSVAPWTNLAEIWPNCCQTG